MVVNIKPEHLLNASDYHYYTTILNKETDKRTITPTNSLHSNSSTSTSIIRFESLSRKAWTDLLLQIIKVRNLILIYVFEWIADGIWIGKKKIFSRPIYICNVSYIAIKFEYRNYRNVKLFSFYFNALPIIRFWFLLKLHLRLIGKLHYQVDIRSYRFSIRTHFVATSTMSVSVLYSVGWTIISNNNDCYAGNKKLMVSF